MHPIEHLRHLARASGADPGLVAGEAAPALAKMARTDPAALVPACRRLVERHLTAGPVWWLCARVLGSADPAEAARQAAEELGSDPTGEQLAVCLPEAPTVVVLGWPEVTSRALCRRGDLEVLVVDSLGEGSGLVRRLREAGNACELVPEPGVGPAAAVADLVVLEALVAAGPGILAAPGSLAAAAVAAHAGVPVWAVTPVGRVIPIRLWEVLVGRFDQTEEEPWERAAQLVPSGLLHAAVGPQGPVGLEQALASPGCPEAPELLRLAG